jgi:hypothetical protein
MSPKPEPIIEYAHKIGKNTAEFTVKDLVAFTRWWMQQPVRKDLFNNKGGSGMKSELTPAQRVEYEKDKAKVQEYYRKQRENNMKTPVDVNQIDDSEAQEEVVAELGLTKKDVEALKWVINQIFIDYDMNEHEYGASLQGINEVLEEVEEL